MKRFNKYVLYIVILVLLLSAGIAIKQINMLRNLEQQAANVSYYYLHSFLMFLIYAICGALIGIESLLKERHNKGRWKINLPKMLILGVPGAIIGLYYLFCLNLWIPVSIQHFLKYFDISALIVIMQVLFGYAVVTSFYKNDINNINETRP